MGEGTTILDKKSIAPKSVANAVLFVLDFKIFSSKLQEELMGRY